MMSHERPGWFEPYLAMSVALGEAIDAALASIDSVGYGKSPLALFGSGDRESRLSSASEWIGRVLNDVESSVAWQEISL